MEQNHLPNIYSADRTNKKSVFDEKIAELDIPKGVEPLCCVSDNESAERIKYYYSNINRRKVNRIIKTAQKKDVYELQKCINYVTHSNKFKSIVLALKNPKLLKLIIKDKLGKDVTTEAAKLKYEIRKKKNEKSKNRNF